MDKLSKKSMTGQTYDKDKLAELAKLAIGGRTLRDFSNISGLSEGFLSRLTTGKLLSTPTRRSLAKLTADICKPQNGITMGMMMAAAGYMYYEPESRGNRLHTWGDQDAMTAVVHTAAFAPFLTASTLEVSGQLGQRYLIDNQRELFHIKSMSGKDIIGIPAFCTPETVEEEIKEAKRNLLMAYSIYDEDIKDKFVIILTNQPEFYKNFDRRKLIGTDGEFYLALTEDFHSFTQQRPVQTIGIEGGPGYKPQGPATYDLTRARN